MFPHAKRLAGTPGRLARLVSLRLLSMLCAPRHLGATMVITLLALLSLVSYSPLSLSGVQEVSNHENEEKSQPHNDFKKQVAELREKVGKARAALAQARRQAGGESSAGRPAKKAKLASPAGPPKLSVPSSDVTDDIAQRFVPENCRIAQSCSHKAWRSWWVAPQSHLGNRSRAWGQHGHHGAFLALLKVVWKQHKDDCGEPCPIEGLRVD